MKLPPPVTRKNIKSSMLEKCEANLKRMSVKVAQLEQKEDLSPVANLLDVNLPVDILFDSILQDHTSQK